MKKKEDYKAGDICFYDSETDKLAVVSFADWSVEKYPSSIFTPIGVVVIPSSHDIYGTGQCVIMSLREMNYNTPDEGSTEHLGVYWGQREENTTLPHLNVAVYIGIAADPSIKAYGTYDSPFLPSDVFDEAQCPTDSLAKYDSSGCFYVAPSPYLEDSSRNPVYYQTENPSSEANCLSDFDGFGNTKALCELATSQPNWKTDDTIENHYSQGYSPAACCCWRFHTEGTKQGDWYLPACGELGYMMVRLKTINNTIENMIRTYGDSIGVDISKSFCYWSSTDHSSKSARCIITNTGYLTDYYKGFRFYVRAFFRF